MTKNTSPEENMHSHLKFFPQVESDHLFALFRSGRYRELEDRARILIEQFPDSGTVWKALGASLQMQDKEALSAVQRAAELLPDDAAALGNLGTALRSSRKPDEAIAVFRRALAIKPDFAQAQNNLGATLQDIGRLDDAIASYRRALEISPDFFEAHKNLGLSLHDLGHFDEAVASYRRALEIKPDSAELHCDLGATQRAQGRFDDAVSSCRRALELDSDFARAHINLGCALDDLSQLDDAVFNFRQALKINPDSTQVRSTLLSLQHYLVNYPAANLLDEARHFGQLVLRQANPYTQWYNVPDAERCLRVGLVSPDIRDHPVGHFLDGVLSELKSTASGRLEFSVYLTNAYTDAVTERIKNCCHACHLVTGISDARLARQIHDDCIDILIDLSGHTIHNRLPLFAWKPAPVQVTWLGYLDTTGVATIDYLIADSWTLPEVQEVNFTEKIFRLPETYLCFTLPEADIEVSPLPAISNGFVTFGCFNNLNKVNDDVVALWACVLKGVPGSRLFLKSKPLEEALVRQRITERFAIHGIESTRLMLEGTVPSRTDHFATYQRVDISLDPFPYPGITTTVESLWMGVPVLTLAGTSFLSRQGVGLLMNAGLPDWIAVDADDYVARAVAHASDLQRLASLREGLRHQVLNSPIFDAPRFAGHFEAALRGMWREWCSGQPLSSPQEIASQVDASQLVGMFNTGRYAELETRTRLLVEQVPDSGIGWKLLGSSLQVQGKDALPALQRAAELLSDDAEVQNNLGSALVDHGQIDDAVAYYRRALEIDPNFAEAHSNLGEALRAVGQFDGALASCRQALRIQPDFAEAYRVLGNVQLEMGQTADAVASHRRALEIKPDFAKAHSNLGLALQSLGQPDDAVASYRRALEIKPDFVEAYSNLGIALQSLGQRDEAVAAYRRALEINPNFANAYNNLGIALQSLGQHDEAVASYRRALDINPNFALAYSNLASTQRDLGQLSDAEASCHRALEIRADVVAAHLNLGNVMRDLGRLDCAVASYGRALEIKPDYADAHCNILFTRNFLSDQPAEVMQAQAKRFGEVARQQARPYTDWPNTPVHHRPLRVGLVSGDLRNHPVGHFIEGVLSELSLNASERLKFIVYANHFLVDELTERIKACCQVWRSVVGVSDARLARQIRDDGIDVLIDLSGHTSPNRLPMFAWKPAPVQVSWLGYFATTGLAAMDYLIADSLTLLDAEEANFTEKIWRLPETRLCFTPPDVDIQVTALPALANGHITFGCFNKLYKINDAVIALWARVLQAVPGSCLFLKTSQFGIAEIRQRVMGSFAANGIASARLKLEGFSPRAEYLAAYQQVDIALDPFPFPGGTTTVESLWMGVPVLTLAGTSFLSRQGVGLLMNAGLPDWIAVDADDYVARAVAHASDLQRLASLREGLRHQVLNSPLFDAPRFAGHFEAALRGMWQTWCSGRADITIQGNESKPMKTFIHVGCGHCQKNQTTRGFNTPQWNELRFDIDQAVNPDIVGTMLDMSAVADESVDALYSAHNIEHLYPHEVPVALAEFRRVLKPDGFAVISCPDLQSVCQLVAEDKLTEPAYNSAVGPIAPLDILYGHRESLQRGNLYMAHRCGFTEKVLVATLQQAGFGAVVSGSRPYPSFDLWAVASKGALPEEELAILADAHFPE